MRTRTVSVGYSIQVEDDEVEGTAEVEVSGRKTAAHFSKSFGNWLPGEDPDVEVISFTAEDGRDLTHLLSAADTEAISDRALEAMEEDDAADAEDAAEARAEARREAAEEARHDD